MRRPIRGLLLNPGATEARAAVETAWISASDDEATLFLGFVGHGEFDGQHFYLLPMDAELDPLRPSTALNLVQQIAELQPNHSNVDGLVVLVDACYSGEAAAAAARQWQSTLAYDLRYEVLTASADRLTTGGCFTRTLVALMRDGLTRSGTDVLRLEMLKSVLLERCPNQVPQHATWNADPGLFLAYNTHMTGSAAALAGTETMGSVDELTEWLQPTGELARVVALSQAVRCVAVTGVAGTGKSTLAAALTRPEVTDGVVPDGFVQATAFASSATDAASLAAQLAQQLKTTIGGFESAAQASEHETPAEQWVSLDALA